MSDERWPDCGDVVLYWPGSHSSISGPWPATVVTPRVGGYVDLTIFGREGVPAEFVESVPYGETPGPTARWTRKPVRP